MKRLAIIGSSGGNLYNQGGNDPKKMMEEIFVQAGSAGIEVAYIQFIGTNTTMDNISMDAKARLWTLDGENSVKCSEEMTLQEINGLSRKNDEELARLIREDKIDGIMLMSCDPKGANKEALKAAAEKKDTAGRHWRNFHGQYPVNGMQGNRCFRYNRYDEPHQGNFGSLSFFKRVEVEVQPNHRLLRQFKGPGRQRVEAD